MAKSRKAGALAVLFAAFASISSPAGSLTMDAKNGRMMMTAGDYKVQFHKRNAWTIGRASYKGEKMLVHKGWHQTVIKMKKGDGGNKLIGSGHGGEKVESVTVAVDGVGKALADITDRIEGNVFTVVKKSRIGPYASLSKVTVSPNGILQDFSFKVVGDASNVEFMYVFMFIFSDTANSWRVGLPDGSMENGTFHGDGKFLLKKNIAWAALEAPSLKSAFLVVYPKVYPSRNDKGNFFWDRKDNNKLYFQVDPPKEVGETFAFNSFLKGYDDSNGDFDKKVGELAAKLIEKVFHKK